MRRVSPGHRVIAVSLAALMLAATMVGAARSPVRADPASGQLDQWARATWASFVAMTPEDTGLPTDSLATDGTRVVETSTTNIGAYLWSTVAAEHLGYIDRWELVDRVETTIASLEGMEIHEPSGQYFNWYDHRDGSKLTTWPSTGDPLIPHLSSVDNGWLATGLRIVRNAVPEVADRAGALYDRMDFGFYYRPDRNQILFHYAPSTGDAPCCYDTIVSESRIASYIGIAEEQIPPRHYFGAWRTFPDSCDWSWQEQRPYGDTQEYFGETVFEGAYPYDETMVVPGLGGRRVQGTSIADPVRARGENWAPPVGASIIRSRSTPRCTTGSRKLPTGTGASPQQTSQRVAIASMGWTPSA